MHRALAIALFAITALATHAQQPFFTDDADVAAYHRWHLEANNEYDVLPISSYPSQRQDTHTIKFSYGLLNHCEVGMDFPLIAIFHSQASGLGTPFGLGDTDYSIKYNFRKEKPGSRWPAITASLNIEPPTGNAKLKLGSGLIDYYLNSIFQKTLSAKSTLRVNAREPRSQATLSRVRSAFRRAAPFLPAAHHSRANSRGSWTWVSNSLAVIPSPQISGETSCKNNWAGITKSRKD